MAAETRREFIEKTVALLPSLSVAARAHSLSDSGSRAPITDVLLDLDHLHKWDNSNGDTWDPFWAEDDNLYAFNCDGRGFGKQQRNLAFNRLTGDSPHTLSGMMINTMDEYGTSGKKEADNATWKACGQECIDSTYYAFVSRNVYGKDSGDYWLRQTAFNSSLIKSTDRGLTWTRSAAENYRRPMWPGRAFGAPFFIHYGKNGGEVSADGADQYVYAVSTNGFWNDGDSYILGRVERKSLPRLSTADWRYFSGGDGGQANNWSERIQDAKPLLELRTHCGQSGPCYIAALGLYLMVVWYNTKKMVKWFEPNEMRYDFYQSPRPWGPWTAIRSYTDQFLSMGHMYGPTLCAKFQRTEETDVHVTLFTAGCQFEDVPSGLYKAWEIPVILRTGPKLPSTLIPSGDDRVTYKGNWKLATNGEALRLGSPEIEVREGRQTSSAGSTAELSFQGVGVDLIAGKSVGAGSIDIFLDDVRVHTADLAIQNLPALRGVTVFRSEALGMSPHRIRVVAKTSSPVLLNAFQVYTA